MDKIYIHEVGLRDGLQVEKTTVPLEEKIRWVEGLFASGVDIIQLGSFVHPEKVPQMADTDALFRYFSEGGKKPGNVTLSGLVLNEKGLESGLACGVEMFCMGVSASETHSQKNTGMTPAEAQARIIPMAKQALSAGKKVQASVQSAFGCGFEGRNPATHGPAQGHPPGCPAGGGAPGKRLLRPGIARLHPEIRFDCGFPGQACLKTSQDESR
ncbi:MAG: hypothetical protein ACUVRJ_07780 [Candidatus Villigracilaceae bacterium]